MRWALGVLLCVAAVGLALRYRRIILTQRLDRVRLQEREQLARELHDTVAHHVSAIAIQAQAGQSRAALQDLDGAADALRLIEAEASRTMAEMRSMVGALREAPSSGRGIADLERLATTEPFPVDIVRHGDLDTLRPAVGTAVYRIVQEGITNATRHARHATRVQVVITGGPDSVDLRINDDGEGSLPNPRPGYGLVGMAERVRLHGGSLEAGPGSERGWVVRATIPR